MTNPTIHVRIISPQQLFFDAEADSVSSKNLDGPFDILPQHANFITMVEKAPIIIRNRGQKDVKFDLPMAIILATDNKVDIYTYIQPESGR